MTALTIDVHAPRFWWRAPADRIGAWVDADPDVVDRRTRWHDRAEQRWGLIAQVVAAVGDALAEAAWIVDPDHDQATHGTVTIDAPRAGLTETELHIVESWFAAGEAVCTDPWFEPIGNGRHRLWSTLPHYDRALVPIQGDALMYANSVDADEDLAGWLDLFRQDVVQLGEVTWFDTYDRLNARFCEALRSAAWGEFPQPV